MEQLSRREALAHRFFVNGLDRRRPRSHLVTAARPGLQDGSPRSALLSLAARIGAVAAADWRHPDLAQVFGPRGAIYVVPRSDIDVFTKGLLPRDPDRIRSLQETAAQVHRVLAEAPKRQSDVVAAIPDLDNSRELRWAACLGSIVPAWDTMDTIVHERQPTRLDPEEARRELARRFYRHLGPATVADLQWWLAGSRADATATTAAIAEDLTEVTIHGNSHYVTGPPVTTLVDPESVHLLPPDDTYINRRTAPSLLPDRARPQLLWPKAPPPGALVIGGEVVGTWRRQGGRVEISAWHRIDTAYQFTAEAIADAWPLGGEEARVSWVTLD